MIFTGSLTLYASMAFIAGYVDVNSIQRFGVLVSLATGNLASGAISAVQGDFSKASLCFLMSFSVTCLGALFSSALLHYFKCRRKALNGIIFTSCIIFTFVDILTKYRNENYRFCAVLLALTSGATLHWVLKLGFTTALMTINGLKLFEALFRLTFNISQGGQKLRGDLLTIVSIILSFIAGTFVTLGMQQYSYDFSLYPLIIIHVYQVLLVNDWIPGVRLGLETPPPAPVVVSTTPGPVAAMTNINPMLANGATMSTTANVAPVLALPTPSTEEFMPPSVIQHITRASENIRNTESGIRPTLAVVVDEDEFILTGEEVDEIEREVDAQMEYEQYRIQMTDYSPAELDRMRRDRIYQRASLLVRASLRLTVSRNSNVSMRQSRESQLVLSGNQGGTISRVNPDRFRNGNSSLEQELPL